MTYSQANRTRTLTVANRVELKVEQAGQAWVRQQPRWELIEALQTGTYGFQQAGKRWLPMEPLEADDSYAIRLANSVLQPYYKNMEAMLAGMIFRKPVRLENVSDAITSQLFDADLNGNNLDVLLHDFTREMVLRYGFAGILVDYPVADDGSQDVSRPYWLPYAAPDVLGGRFDVVEGTRKLTQLRLREHVVLPYGDFGEEFAEQIRVLEPGKWRLYRKSTETGNTFELIGEGATTLPVIPFAPCYVGKVGDLEARPPLEEIAWLNLQAYRRGSDLQNQLHIAAVPRLMLYGFPAEVEELEAGPGSATGCPSDAKAEFIEPQGTSYEYQFRHLNEIEAQINRLGVATILGQKMAAETEASKAIDRSQGDANLSTIAQALQDCVDNCLRFHAAYLGEQSPGNSIVNRDFVSARLDSQQVAQILAGYNSAKPLYTQETCLRMLNDGEWLPDDFDVEQEIAATEAMAEQQLQDNQDALDAAMRTLPGQGGDPSTTDPAPAT